MKVILLKSVPKIGKKYDVMDVSSGFAMNSLFPRGLAELATAKGLVRVKELKAAEEVERKVREDLLLKNLGDIASASITIEGKANDKGHLFAGLHKAELVAALKEQARVDITEEYIVLDKAIKEVGEHKVEVKVQDKSAEFTLTVKAL
jgi:large subunit ribosomal protein L9